MIVFAHVDKDVRDNVEDALDAILEDNARDIHEVAFDSRDCFVKDACEVVFNDKDCFVEMVSMYAIANINILVIGDFVDNVEGNVKGVSILIIINRDHVELGFAREQIKAISIVFFV